MESPAAPRPSLTITSQYIKDLSFESPRLPLFRTLRSQPRDEISLGIEITPIADTVFEVALMAAAASKRVEAVGFIIEFIYAGAFDLRGFPPEHRDAALHIEAPELLFPFARKILLKLVLINGFPFVVPPSFDFVGRYADELARTRRDHLRLA
jgi:preprotein translocase subunit SecB